MDIAAPFDGIDVLAGLPDRALKRLAAGATSITLTAGDTFNVLEKDGSVLFVKAGRVRASSLEEGRISFADLAAPQAHGLVEAIVDSPAKPCALLAMDDAEIVIVSAEALRAAIRSSAAASFALASHFAADLAKEMSPADPLQKVYRDILKAARPVGDARWSIDPMPRHRDLAAAAGVAESDAAAAIAHLVRIGVARRRYPALDIEDRDALRTLAG